MTVMRVIDGDSHEAAIARQTAPRRRATIELTQVTDIAADGTVTVNLGGNDRTATTMLDTPLAVGDNVLIVRQDKQLIIVGPVDDTTRPMTGIVASVPTNSWEIVVSTSVGAQSCNFVDSYTPAVGDTVLLLWAGSSPVVIGQMGKTGSPAPPPATPAPSRPVPRPRPPTPKPPPRKPVGGIRTFPAVSCGTYRNGGWRNDANGNVIQGTAPGVGGANHGAWFYAGQPAANLHGATVLTAWIWLRRVDGGNYGAQAVHLFRVQDNRHPTGHVDITYGAATDNVSLNIGQSGWFRISTDLAQAVVDSGGCIGVKAPSGPYVRLAGLAQTGRAGALRLKWRR